MINVNSNPRARPRKVGRRGQNNNPGTNGYRTSYTYDPASNLMGVTQGVQTRTFTYDHLSRITAEMNPETSINGAGGWIYYTYDSDATCGSHSGSQVKRVDPANNVTCYSYDSLGRVLQISYPSGPNSANTPTKHFAYDAASAFGISLANYLGRMTAAWTTLGAQMQTQEAFSYDARGSATNLYEWVAGPDIWYESRASYAVNGPVSQRSGYWGYPGSTVAVTNGFSYSQDGKGHVNGLTDTTLSQSVWASTTFNALDEPTAINFSNGDYEQFGYDPNTGRMAWWNSDIGSQTPGHRWQTGSLNWNDNGTLQQLAIIDTYNSTNNQTCTYTYDDLGRLNTNHCDQLIGQHFWGQDFTYDVWGNITKTQSSGYPNGINFLQGYGSGNHVSGFTYDAMGNITNDGSSYSYDAEGRQLTAAGVTTTFDAFDRAVKIVNGGSTTQIMYAPDGYKFALMNGSTVSKYFLPLTAGVQAVYTANTPAGVAYYRHVDWLGSSRLGSNANRTVRYDLAYAPFGETYASVPAVVDRSFTGQTQDTISGPTGMYDFLLRQQSAAQGRWMVPDPAGIGSVDMANPQTWNRYNYVSNNPLNAVDPAGTEPCIVGFFYEDCGSSGGGGGYDGNGYCPPWNEWCGDPPPPCCGGGGGGGGEPEPPQSGQPIHFPNETLGIPDYLPRVQWGIWGSIIPNANCGDFGPCPTIGNGFGDAAAIAIGGGTIICQIAEPCGAIEDTLLLGGLIVESGAVIYLMGKKQTNEKVEEAKAARPKDPCGWLAQQLEATTDSATKGKIVTAQKYLGCRNKRKR
jgi:RHS repeat-associated protein